MAGRTSYDGSGSGAALLAITDVWNHPTDSYIARRDAVHDKTRTWYLAEKDSAGAAATVFEDAAIDVVVGSENRDLYYVNTDALNKDTLISPAGDETVYDLD